MEERRGQIEQVPSSPQTGCSQPVGRCREDAPRRSGTALQRWLPAAPRHESQCWLFLRPDFVCVHSSRVLLRVGESTPGSSGSIGLSGSTLPTFHNDPGRETLESVLCKPNFHLVSTVPEPFLIASGVCVGHKLPIILSEQESLRLFFYIERGRGLCWLCNSWRSCSSKLFRFSPAFPVEVFPPEQVLLALPAPHRVSTLLGHAFVNGKSAIQAQVVFNV